MSKKITRKSYKRNKLVLGASLFAGVALVSTGFAAWVISSSVSQDQSGNVEVGVVENQSVTMTLDSGEKNFKFEPVKQSGYIIQPDSDTNVESLSVVVSGTLTNAKAWAGSNSLSIKMATDTGIDAAVSAKYITTPTCYNSDTTIAKKTDTKATVADITEDGWYPTSDENKFLFKYTVTFAWGDAFKNVNPAQYYTECYNYLKSGTAGTKVTSKSDLPEELQADGKTANDVSAYAEKTLKELRMKIYQANDADYTTKAAPTYKITVTANVGA